MGLQNNSSQELTGFNGIESLINYEDKNLSLF